MFCKIGFILFLLAYQSVLFASTKDVAQESAPLPFSAASPGGIPAAPLVRYTIQIRSAKSVRDLAREVADARSDRYGQFYSPDEIRIQSGIDDSTYRGYIRQMRRQGFDVFFESSTHLWMGLVARDSSSLRVPHAPWIESVSRNQEGPRRRPQFVKSRLTPRDPVVIPGLKPDQIFQYYHFDTIRQAGWDGEGEDMAIATYDDVDLPTVQQYFANLNLKTPQIDKILFNGTPDTNEFSAVETSMDAELMGMMAPGARIHIFTSANNDDASEVQMFNAILDDNRAKVISYSWGGCEGTTTKDHMLQMDQIFARAVAQGVNVFVASGDSGSVCNNIHQAGWPAADPNIVSVGGTILTANSGSYSEAGWSCTDQVTSCSGGGESSIFPLPSYQNHLPPSFKMRAFPDIAFNADEGKNGEPVWVTYLGVTGWNIFGGTSMATPQWAALVGLANQARLKAGRSRLGFLNPILYGMNDEARAAAIRDITSGDNGDYQAGPGWDAVTGWGSPQGASLFDALLHY